MSTPNNFALKQWVVYPSQGVGFIEKIEEKMFKGASVPYYVINLDGSDMTVMVPVDKAETLGIRAIVPAKEADRALDFMREDFEPNTNDWKLRYQQNLELLKKGTILDIAAIVRSLYHRSRVKELPIMERKLYDTAYKILEDEISCSLKKSKEDIDKIIIRNLESKVIKEIKESKSKKSKDEFLDDDDPAKAKTPANPRMDYDDDD